MHHKRRHPKNRRAGCLMCKPWKMNGMGRSAETMQERRAREAEARQHDTPARHGRGKRTFLLEYRPVEGTFMFRHWGGHWRTYKRYRSERDRDNALAGLQKSDERYFRFRKA